MPAGELIRFHIEACNADRHVFSVGEIPRRAPESLIGRDETSGRGQHRAVRIRDYLPALLRGVPFDHAGASPIEKVDVATIDSLGAIPDVGLRRRIRMFGESAALAIEHNELWIGLAEEVNFLPDTNATA